MSKPLTPGPIALFGSGETSPSGQKIFDHLLRQLPQPPQIALLETPAGFELNTEQVIGRVAEFLHHRLQNYKPQIQIIPARQRGTPFSPDDPQIAAPLLHAHLIFAGPGSPTYAARQLRNSLTWYNLLARHRLGAALVFASAAVIAAGAQTLPVYEIYKAGTDLHWQPGLDLFAPFGLALTFIPHWNNTEGGTELDTRYCFMGQARFAALREILPSHQTVIGIDEHTALLIDCAGQRCEVRGMGTVTLLRENTKEVIPAGTVFSLTELGDCEFPAPSEGLPPEVWAAAQKAVVQISPEGDTVPPEDVQSLVAQRQAARARQDWPASDALRAQIAALGWQVQDTPSGPLVSKG